MNLSVESLIWGLAISFFHVFIVVAALKCFSKIAPVLIHAASALFSLILLYLAGTIVELDLWIALSVLAFSASSYLFMFGAIYKSLTLRILCTAKSRKGPLSIDQLDQLVTLPTFTTRVKLLNEMGNVAAESERYFLTPKGKKTAHFFHSIRRIFKVETKAIYKPLQIKPLDEIRLGE